MKRLVSTVAILACLGAGTAQGAPAPKHLGETASAITAETNCACTAIQFGDLGTANNSYVFPYSGVITKSGFYVGVTPGAADWVQMRSFSHSGTNRVTVAGDGAKHMLQGLPQKSIASFYERLPVSALGVLGARYSIAGSFEVTPTYFSSVNAVDEVIGTATNLAVGDSWEETPGKNKRVNVEAVLEPDEDHDDYGDVSQDLCPGSPIGGGPCSGTLFGSDLQEAHGTGGGAAFEPLLVQKTVDGSSTALPFDGVVVRWRVLSSHSDQFRVRVLSPQGGSGLKVLGASAVESVSVAPSPPIGTVTSFPTRLPIPAGSYVGLASPTKSLAPIALHASGASATEYHDAPDGSTIGEPGTARSWEVAYDADVEPDADHDGYGDLTQDSCPEAGSVHDGVCPLKDDIPPPPPPKPHAKTPRIASVKRDKKGRYELKVKVQQAGTIAAQLTGRLKPKSRAVKLGKDATKSATKPGTYALTLKPPKAARELGVRTKLTVTLSAPGFLPAQASRSLRVK